MEAATIKRIFVYQGTKIPDPNPEVSPDEVRNILTSTHPELANAAIEGPKVNGDEHTFTFVKSVGTKG